MTIILTYYTISTYVHVCHHGVQLWAVLSPLFEYLEGVFWVIAHLSQEQLVDCEKWVFVLVFLQLGGLHAVDLWAWVLGLA